MPWPWTATGPSPPSRRRPTRFTCSRPSTWPTPRSDRAPASRSRSPPERPRVDLPQRGLYTADAPCWAPAVRAHLAVFQLNRRRVVRHDDTVALREVEMRGLDAHKPRAVGETHLTLVEHARSRVT